MCFNRYNSISSCQRRSELIGQMLCFLLNTRVWNWSVFVNFYTWFRLYINSYT